MILHEGDESWKVQKGVMRFSKSFVPGIHVVMELTCNNAVNQLYFNKNMIYLDFWKW